LIKVTGWPLPTEVKGRGDWDEFMSISKIHAAISGYKTTIAKTDALGFICSPPAIMPPV
jgi:hypothetical protein